MATLIDDYHQGAKRKKGEVSRLRRAIFTWVVVACSIVLPSTFVFSNKEGKLVETVADGLISMGMLVASVYIGGSSADFIATRLTSRTPAPLDDDTPRPRRDARVERRPEREPREEMIEK